MRTFPSILILILSLQSCSIPLDDQANMGAPNIRTSEVTDIGSNSATSGGFELMDNNSDIFEKGICWDTLPNPEVTSVTHLHTVNGEGTGKFSATMEWLQDETEYYVRAFAVNQEGISYGGELTFTTSEVILDIECNPDPNTFDINFTEFNSVETGWDVPIFGEYGLVAHSQSIDFYIGFETPPRSGVYTNVGFNTPNEFLWTRECSMSATNIGVVPGGSVYVDRISKDNYSITFCDLEFSVGASTIIASGNLTSE